MIRRCPRIERGFVLASLHKFILPRSLLPSTSSDLLNAVIPRRAEQPRSDIRPLDRRLLIPELEEDFLRGIFGIAGISEEGSRKPIDIIAVPAAVGFEF